MKLETQSSRLALDLMSASAQRARILANNVANQNVPGFQRQDVEFESLLAKEFERGGADIRRIQPKVVTDEETPSRADGNNVRMEREKALQGENGIMYELYATLFDAQMSLIGTAITGRRS